MNSIQIQDTSCFESHNSCFQSKWFVVALAVSSLVFLGAAVFGGTGLFASNLPQWLAHAVGTIGHSGCLAMLMWGTVLGGACAITAIVLVVKRYCDLSTHHSENLQAPDVEVRETEVNPPNEESIETLNDSLFYAARNGRVIEITTLLDRGANIEATTQAGWTPLMFAASRGHMGAIRTLLDRGANIEATDLINGSTPLMCAAHIGHVEAITTLLDRGANIEATDRHGETPLILASGKGHVDAITTLLRRGANIHATDNEGTTALDLASGEAFQILSDWRSAHSTQQIV